MITSVKVMEALCSEALVEETVEAMSAFQSLSFKSNPQF